MGNRQAEELTARSVADVDAYYAGAERAPADQTDVLGHLGWVCGKGIVMGPALGAP